MDDFNIVSSDIIKAIENIEYGDMDKRFIQTQILYNIYNLIKDEESFKEGIKVLSEREISTKRRGLVYNIVNNQ